MTFKFERKNLAVHKERHIKKFLALLYCLQILQFAGCNESINSPYIGTISFPEFFIEKGSDSDTTYLSLKGFRNNDHFEIQATGWGIWEFGLFLQRVNCEGTINYSLMGECGTVTSQTWKKITFVDFITPDETDTLWTISFTDFRDTIKVVKVVAH